MYELTGRVLELRASLHRNGKDLAEVKILRKSGKNTQKNYTKKIFTTEIIMMV